MAAEVAIGEIVAAWADRGRTNVGEPDQIEFGFAVLRELAKGAPVTPARAAELTDAYTVSDIADLFQAAARRGVEIDDSGALVGNALTLTPTPHRIQVGDTDLYAWCSLDTLFLPALIGTAARVSSTDPITGTEVRLTVSPAGVLDYSPATARISVVVPGHTPACDADGMTGPASATCSQMHFFANPDSAATWAADRPGVQILTIEEGDRVARVLATNGCNDRC